MAAPIALIVSSVIGGLTGYLQTSAKNKAAKSQAQQLLNNAKILEGEIARGELNMNEALTRIDTLIGTAKGEVQSVMEKQVDMATADIKKQFTEGLGTAMDEIRGELGQRRLLGSGFGQEVRAKTAKGITKQAGEQTADARQKAANEIAAALSGLTLKGGMLKEGKRGEFEQFRSGTLGEILQLQNVAKSLKSGQASPFLAAFSGAAQGGLGDIISQFVGPSAGKEGEATLREPGTGSTALPSGTK